VSGFPEWMMEPPPRPIAISIGGLNPGETPYAALQYATADERCKALALALAVGEVVEPGPDNTVVWR
jgi:hypothetical protein